MHPEWLVRLLPSSQEEEWAHSLLSVTSWEYSCFLPWSVPFQILALCLFPSPYLPECSFTFLDELSARLAARLFNPTMTITLYNSNILDSVIVTQQILSLFRWRFTSSRLYSNHHSSVAEFTITVPSAASQALKFSLTLPNAFLPNPDPMVGCFRGAFSSILVALTPLSFCFPTCQTPTLNNCHSVLLILASLPGSLLKLFKSVFKVIFVNYKSDLLLKINLSIFRFIPL